MSKYEVGDLVRVKELDVLKEEFGATIRIPSGWNPVMKELCGGEFTIMEVAHRRGGKCIYYFSEDNRWMIDECILEDVPDDYIDPEVITISYDEFF